MFFCLFKKRRRNNILLREQVNSNKQGDVGVGRAIAHFVSQGFTVSVPLTDSQEYDLVVGDDSGLKKVQVKTTCYKRNSVFTVNLKTSSKKKNRNLYKSFDASKCDLLYILTDEDEEYIIPCEELEAETSLSMSDKYSKYKIN